MLNALFKEVFSVAKEAPANIKLILVVVYKEGVFAVFIADIKNGKVDKLPLVLVLLPTNPVEL